MNAEMAKVLTKALSEMKNPELSGTAIVPTKSGGEYSYQYARLPEILNAAREIFAKHGLSIQQDVSGGDGSVSVQTVIRHSSGEQVESSILSLPSGGSPQTAGSAITYARRYQLTAYLGITGEEDDDGNAAEPKPHTDSPPPRATGERTPGGATVKQMNYAKSLCVQCGLAQKGPDGEDDHDKAMRRARNIEAVTTWLHDLSYPVEGDDPLMHLTAKQMGEVIDILKRRADELKGA